MGEVGSREEDERRGWRETSLSRRGLQKSRLMDVTAGLLALFDVIERTYGRTWKYKSRYNVNSARRRREEVVAFVGRRKVNSFTRDRSGLDRNEKKLRVWCRLLKAVLWAAEVHIFDLFMDVSMGGRASGRAEDTLSVGDIKWIRITYI